MLILLLRTCIRIISPIFLPQNPAENFTKCAHSNLWYRTSHPVVVAGTVTFSLAVEAENLVDEHRRSLKFSFFRKANDVQGPGSSSSRVARNSAGSSSLAADGSVGNSSLAADRSAGDSFVVADGSAGNSFMAEDNAAGNGLQARAAQDTVAKSSHSTLTKETATLSKASERDDSNPNQPHDPGFVPSDSTNIIHQFAYALTQLNVPNMSCAGFTFDHFQHIFLSVTGQMDSALAKRTPVGDLVTDEHYRWGREVAKMLSGLKTAQGPTEPAAKRQRKESLGK